MSITSPSFLALLFAALLLFLLLRRNILRKVILFLVSAAFIASQANSISELLPLGCFIVGGYGLIAVAARPLPGALFALLVAVYVLTFAYIKQYAVLAFLGTPLSAPYVTVGVSYILFRVLHVAIDVRAGLVKQRISPFDYLLYIGSIFSFASGPIQRYEDFEQQNARLDAHVLTPESIYAAFTRIANGLIVALLVAEPLLHVHSAYALRIAAGADVTDTVTAYWVAALLYTLYMYASFASYMSIVIGFAALFGFTLPENFDRPFASASLVEFWSRWHITLSKWFQTYVFNPIQLSLVRRWSKPRLAPYLGSLAFFVTFLLMGVWHGSTAAFLVYGLMLGFGTSGNRLYQVIMQRRLGNKRYGALKQRTLYVLVSRGMTFSYFTMALSCFWLEPAALAQVFREQGFVTLPLIILGTGLALTTLYAVRAVLDRALTPLKPMRESSVVRQAVLSAKVALLISLAIVGVQQAAEFVYQVF